jgi:hypothetical protein
MNGGITDLTTQIHALVGTWGNTRYIYALYQAQYQVYTSLIIQSWTQYQDQVGYQSCFWIPNIRTRLVIKVVFKYPIPGPGWLSKLFLNTQYQDQTDMFKRWYLLNIGSHFYVREEDLVCVCVGKDNCHDISNTYWANAVLQYFAYFAGKTLLSCCNKQMCNQFQYHVPLLLLILQQQVVTNKG